MPPIGSGRQYKELINDTQRKDSFTFVRLCQTQNRIITDIERIYQSISLAIIAICMSLMVDISY